LLIVTAFSTWNVVAIMTPTGSLSFVREVAAVGVVEGAFLGFEFATAKAKSARQVKLATIGFFCSLAVIGLFAGLSGLLEFGGNDLLDQSAGDFLGLAWTARYAVMAFALAVFVLWIVALASIYRLYSLADPDKIAELAKVKLSGEVADEANNALKLALEKAKPVIARVRAEAQVIASYKDELTQDQLDRLVGEVGAHLANHYGAASPASVRVPEPGAILADPDMPIIPDTRRTFQAETPTAGEPFRTDSEE